MIIGQLHAEVKALLQVRRGFFTCDVLTVKDLPAQRIVARGGREFFMCIAVRLSSGRAKKRLAWSNWASMRSCGTP